MEGATGVFESFDCNSRNDAVSSTIFCGEVDPDGSLVFI